MDDRELLSRWLSSELSDAERAALEARLAREPALAAELEELRELTAAAAALPRSIEPRRDLWPSIERRLAAETPVRAGRSTGGWLRAAAVAAVIFAGGVLLGRYVPGGAKAPVASAPPDTVAKAAHPLPTEEEWAAASAELYRALEASGRLDPATEAAVRENLEIIDAAVREIRTALAEDPSNPRLQKLLTAEYRKRSTVLRRAASLNVLPLRIGFESST